MRLSRIAFALLPLLAPGAVLAQQAPAAAPSPGQLLQQGALYMRQGHPDLAEQDFRRVTAADPRLSDGWLGLGMALLRQSQPEEAAKDLQRAVALGPTVPGTHLFLGIAQYQLNNDQAAIASLKAEVRLQPKNVDALTWLGIVELGAGDPDQAVGPLDRAYALRPNDPNILDYRGRAHTMVAQECYKKLFELNPHSWRVYRAMAELDDETHQPERAVTEYQAAIQQQPNDPELYEALGGELQLVSRFADATAAYQHELRLDPGNSTALYNLGKIQIHTGNTAAGVALLQKAIARHAPLAPANFYLGLGMLKLGHNQQAIHAFTTCLASQPSAQMAQRSWYQLARLYKTLGQTQNARHAIEQFQKLKAAAAPAAPAQP